MIPIETFQPRHLYRYRSLAGNKWNREIDAITASTIWFSNLEAMNDPMEGSYSANLRVKKLTKYEQIKSQIFHGKIEIGICSFSETNNNGPMWAHYADEFRGICVEYDLKKLLASPIPANQKVSLTRVTYSEDRYQLTLTSSTDQDIARKILSFKSHRWLYEREWRLFWSNIAQHLQLNECISHVYIGKRMKVEDIGKLEKALSDSKIPISVMKVRGYTIGFSKLPSPKS